jgi:hypothetical protein
LPSFGPSALAIATLSLLKTLLICAVSLLWTLRIRRIPSGQVLFYASILLACAVESGATYLSAWSTTTEIYAWYLILEFLLLLTMTTRSLRRSWTTGLAIAGGLGFLVVSAWEHAYPAPDAIIAARSTLFGFSVLTFLCVVLLMDLVESATVPLWKDQRFWTYFSIFIFMGPAIPFLGLLNHIYAQDPVLAEELFIIIDVLFFLRYGSALVAAWLLTPQQARP